MDGRLSGVAFRIAAPVAATPPPPPPTALTVDAYIDGVLQASATVSSPPALTGPDFGEFDIQAIITPATATPYVPDVFVRNIKVGSTDGGSELWNPTITTTVAPPFSSIFLDGTAGAIAAAGVIDFSLAASSDQAFAAVQYDHYPGDTVVDDMAQPTNDVYIYLDLKVSAGKGVIYIPFVQEQDDGGGTLISEYRADLTITLNGDGTADFLTTATWWDAATSDGGSGAATVTLAPDTWYTIALKQTLS